MAILFDAPDAQMLEERNWRQTFSGPPEPSPDPFESPSANWGILRSIPGLAPEASEDLPHADRIDLQLRCRTALPFTALAREYGRTTAHFDDTRKAQFFQGWPSPLPAAADFIHSLLRRSFDLNCVG